MVRRMQMLGLICWLGSTSLMAAGPSPGRLTNTFEGIECEFSPGQEAFTQALAHRFRVHNAAVAAALASEKGQPDPAIPLSPAEMRTNRAAYLGRIAALLGLERPTAWQEECYDAFLGNYEETMILSGLLRTGFRSLQIVPQMAV